eukprot:GFKZ01005241.1.p1 GENE.GFKZ01005241.1~~GFKZ01005241.1.p1  ORF type:complete len:892 (-),score=115.44 GFKZ01005241.1:1475-3967(-)
MPSSFPNASASDAPPCPQSSLPPPPAPLVEGEHVLATFQPSTPPVDAVVVRLDEVYQAAATYFLRNQSSNSPPHPHTVDLTLDLEDQDDPVPYTVTNGNVDVDPGDVHPTKIMFREAQDSRSPRASRASAASNTPRPDAPASHPNGGVIPSANPAPHPITEGKVYIHFSGRDRRMDRWVDASDLVRASASSIAAAASLGAETTLVDGAASADIAAADANSKTVPKLTRSRRRALEERNPVSEKDVGDEVVAALERAREESTKVRNISQIVFGKYSVDAWYFSPYPGEYGKSERLYICAHCLKYMNKEIDYAAHCAKCDWNSPPGLLVYDDSDHAVRVYEIDGIVSTLYCQNLCLLAKLFLDHKTLYFDVAPFLFYVVTIAGEVAGFFSKEKPMFGSEYNLACILTLPQHQRKGIGRFLISLSYELTRREGKTGGPEHPLSDLGQVSYRTFWQFVIITYLRSKNGVSISTKEIAQATGIRNADVVATLKSLNLISIWKGETYGDARSKALDAAEKKVRAPRLQFRPQLLKDSVTSTKQSTTAAKSSRPKKKKQKKTAEKPKSATRRTKSPAPRTPSVTSVQMRTISSFIAKHSSPVVNELINTYSGLPAPEIRDLAHQTGMSVEDCLAKVQKMASTSLDLGREFSKKRERSPTPTSDDVTCKRPMNHHAGSSRAGPSIFNDEIYPGANDETVVGASPDEYGKPREAPFDSPGDIILSDPPKAPYNKSSAKGTNFVRHQSIPDIGPFVHRSVQGTDVPRAMYAHGIDENGLSDILGDEDVRNGLVHTPRKLEFLETSGSHFDFAQDASRRGKTHSRKHANEVVVVNSGSSKE